METPTFKKITPSDNIPEVSLNLHEYELFGSTIAMIVKSNEEPAIELFFKLLNARKSWFESAMYAMFSLSDKEQQYRFAFQTLNTFDKTLRSKYEALSKGQEEINVVDQVNNYNFSYGTESYAQLDDRRHVAVRHFGIDDQLKTVHISLERGTKIDVLNLPLVQCEALGIINWRALRKVPINI